jgi:hypothetical protein
MYNKQELLLTFFRAPPLPIICFHGNCYLDCLEVLRERNVTQGLKFLLVTEGIYIYIIQRNLFKLKMKKGS